MVNKTIDTLVEDISSLFQGHGFSDAIDRFSSDLGETFKTRFKEYAEEREPSLRLSNYGRPLRQLWYELNGFKPEPLTSSAKFKFLYGSILEGLLLLLAEEAGHSVTDFQRTVEVNGVLGHLDAIIDGVVVDVKSASTYSFNKFKSGEIRAQDPFGYIPQLAAYSHGMGGLDGAFLVVDKTLGNIHLERFPKEELSQINPEMRINTVREMLKSPNPPARCYPLEPFQKSGNLKLSVGCSYCAHKTECFKDANNGEGLKTYYYAHGPVHLAVVKKEPRVNQQEEVNSQ